MENILEQFKISLEENGGIFHFIDKNSLNYEIEEIIGTNDFMVAGLENDLRLMLERLSSKGYYLDYMIDENNLKNLLKNIKIGITGVDAAAAESGSIIIADENYLKSYSSFLPEIHIAISSKDVIFPTLFDAIHHILKTLGKKPNVIQIIQGPSKTGDIEKKIVRPSHGPKEFHVIVLR
ncbi:MAG: lactate utilization protein [Thermoplasmata archaeon]